MTQPLTVDRERSPGIVTNDKDNSSGIATSATNSYILNLLADLIAPEDRSTVRWSFKDRLLFR